jgi:phenylacetate-CoA ligase
VARARADVREALFGDDPRLPMVFQYNPLIHHLEINGDRELICTITRLDVLAPRIRYNVHDEAGLLSYAETVRRLDTLGVDIRALNQEPGAHGPRGPLPWSPPIPLPFLFVYGRRDATISVMGANIYPEDLEAIIYGNPRLAAEVHSFILSLTTDDSGNPRPCISLELGDARLGDAAWVSAAEAQLQQGLNDLNRDYREALMEFPAAMRPVVRPFALGEGPFKDDATRIKPRRIVREPVRV